MLSNCAIAQNIEQQMNSIVKLDKLRPLSQKELPIPYNYLLTQPKMTIGIEHYYQRKAFIKTIYTKQGKKHYSRIILMVLNNSKTKANIDPSPEESAVAELAFITMNFKELPINLKNDVKNTNIPFGKLLEIHQIKTASLNRSYFSTKCNKMLANLIFCKINETIYGRRNTLIRTDNNLWVAQVVEILPALILP